MSWFDAVSESVSQGKTNFQFAIPDGVYEGDLFFITNKENRILHTFVWASKQWFPQCTVWDIQNEQGTKGLA